MLDQIWQQIFGRFLDNLQIQWLGLTTVLVAHDQTFLFKCLIDNNFDFKLGGWSSATSELTTSQWKAPSNSWNKFEIQAFEQIGNDKKAQIHVLFRQNLEKRFVVFWLSPEIAVFQLLLKLMLSLRRTQHYQIYSTLYSIVFTSWNGWQT